MYETNVEIYSDASNFAVMRHPGRKFPGALIQGDTLYALCRLADEACDETKAQRALAEFNASNELRNRLWERLNHYKETLSEHKIPLPFSEDHE